jgi:hypothetical protein
MDETEALPELQSKTTTFPSEGIMHGAGEGNRTRVNDLVVRDVEMWPISLVNSIELQAVSCTTCRPRR